MPRPKTVSARPDDIVRLDALIDRLFEDVMRKEEKTKVADLLKAIELRRKLGGGDDRTQEFWRMIQSLRQEALPLSGAKRHDDLRAGAGKDPQ